MDDKTVQRIIELAGLTKIESKVYLTLLDMGKSLANDISRRTGVHRRSIYDVMDRLVEKGIVNYIVENNKRFFSAANPERLLEIVEEKQAEIKKVIPELVGKFNFLKEKQETAFFKGKEGVKSVFEDQLSEGKEILIFGASTKAHDILKYYFPHYDKKRVTKKINAKIIFDESARNNKNIENIPMKEARYVPRDLLGMAATCIYGNKVAIVVWKEDPMAILITQKEVAASYKAYFNLIWGIAKP